ncbi:MAG: DUF721 domain-containing protein [Methylocystis sp.]|jgi:hypothetical protein
MSVAPRKKRVFARPLAEYVLERLDPLVAKKGFGEASLLMQWREIVGARISDICAPERLQWPARARKPSPDKPQEPATLILRVEPGFGLEIQHLAPAIIDRINAHLGWRCVSKVNLRQQALARRAQNNAPRIVAADPEARARAAAAVEGVADESLRTALARLGERALAQRGKA